MYVHLGISVCIITLPFRGEGREFPFDSQAQAAKLSTKYIYRKSLRSNKFQVVVTRIQSRIKKNKPKEIIVKINKFKLQERLQFTVYTGLHSSKIKKQIRYILKKSKYIHRKYGIYTAAYTA